VVEPSPNDLQVRRIAPQSGLDFNMLLTDTMWGSPQISKQLSTKMKNRAESGGQNDEDQQAAWELLAFYTRDNRLGNLSRMFGEVEICSHYTDLAGDLLREGMNDSFATSLARSATVLELSQSVGGFLRKRQNTLTTENLQGEVEPQKKRLLFGGKKRDG
jgi:hypothetical protein